MRPETIHAWRQTAVYCTTAGRMEGNGRDPARGPTSVTTTNLVITGVITKETSLARLLPSELELDPPVAIDVGGAEDRLQQRLGAAGVEGLDVLEERAHACG